MFPFVEVELAESLPEFASMFDSGCGFTRGVVKVNLHARREWIVNRFLGRPQDKHTYETNFQSAATNLLLLCLSC